jgi:hypothetical protein
MYYDNYGIYRCKNTKTKRYYVLIKFSIVQNVKKWLAFNFMQRCWFSSHVKIHIFLLLISMSDLLPILFKELTFGISFCKNWQLNQKGQI